MSSTISVSRRVGALRTDAGVFYALFESTYESNVHPQIPSEECVGFGRIGEVTRRILALTADTCVGMLRRPGGNFTPVGYLNTWLDALKTPFDLPDHKSSLEVSDKWRSGVEQSQAYPIAYIMEQAGHADLGLDFRTGKPVHLELHRDAALIAALCDTNKAYKVAPWRLLRGNFSFTTSARELDPHLNTAAVGEVPMLFSSTRACNGGTTEEFLAQTKDGLQWFGGKMDVMEKLICHVAMRLEEANVGSGIATVKLLDKLLRQPQPSIPPDTAVIIDIRHEVQGKHWHQEAIDDVLSPFRRDEKPIAGLVLTNWGRIEALHYDVPGIMRRQAMFILPFGRRNEVEPVADLFGIAA